MTLREKKDRAKQKRNDKLYHYKTEENTIPTDSKHNQSILFCVSVSSLTVLPSSKV